MKERRWMAAFEADDCFANERERALAALREAIWSLAIQLRGISFASHTSKSSQEIWGGGPSSVHAGQPDGRYRQWVI